MGKFVLPSDTDPAPTSSSGGTFVLPSDLDAHGNPPPQASSTMADVAKGAASGLAQGEAGLAAAPRGIMDLIRKPVDWAYGQTAGRVENYLTKGTTDAIPASVIASGREDLMPTYQQTKGAVEDVTGPLYEAQTLPGRLAQKTGEYLPSVVAGGAGGLGRALTVAAGSGVGDEAAGAATKGTWAEPYARIAGSIVGGGLGTLGADAGKAILPAVSKTAAENDAARIVQNASSDPAALRQAAATPKGMGPSNTLLPGWNETSAQQFKDQGLFDLEKAVQTRNPSAFVENEAGTGTAQQNAAGESYIKSLQKPGDPSDVPAMFLRQKQAIEDAHDALASRADKFQQKSLADIGGNQSADAYGRAISGDLTPQFQAAQKGAQDAASAIGGTDRPDVYGSALRGAADDAAEASRQNLNALYAVVPKNVTTPITPLKQMAADLYSDTDPALQTTFKGPEKAIAAAIQQYPDNISFGSARNIDTALTTAMREEQRASGRSAAWGRMSQMKSAWEDAIYNALDKHDALEQRQVAAGAMAPEDTVAAKIQGWVDNYRAQKDGLAASGDGSFGSAPGRNPGAVGLSGTAGSARGPVGGTSSNQGIPQGPTISQADIDALNAAKAATKENVSTFKKGPVGQILQSDGTKGSFKVPDAAVPAKVLPSGDGGFQAVQAYKKAVGDDAAASDALHNYAASTLRKVALNDDGTLNPAGYAKWRKSYDQAFQALPADVQQSFGTAGSARTALDKFGDFTPSMRAHEVPELFFSPGPSGAEGVNKLRSMVGQSKADPILSDYAASLVKQKAINADGTVNQKALSTFTKAHDDALSQFPALKKSLSTIDGTSKLMADVAASRAQKVKALENGAAKKFLGLDDPTEVRDAVGHMIDGNNVTGLRKLMGEVKADPAAEAGLKRAAAEHLAKKFLSESSQAGTTGTKDLMRGTFLNTLNDKRAALQQVLSNDQMKGLDMLAEGIRSSNLTTNATKIKGSPNTAADYIRAMKFEPAHREPLLRKILEASIAGTEVGGEHAGIAGAALAVGNHLKNAIRDTGMRHTYELVEKAVLDPEFMKALIAKAPITKGAGTEVTLAHRLGRYSMFRAAQGNATAQNNDQSR